MVTVTGNISDYLRTALLNHALGVAPYVSPATVWAGLFLSPPPTSAGGGTEVTASDYGRVTTKWNVAAVGTIANSLDIRFPANGGVTSDWSVATALGLFDAATGGNLLFYGPLSAAVQLPLGTDFRVGIGGLTIGLS